MKHLSLILLSSLFLGGLAPQLSIGNTITIENSSGEKIELEIDSEDCFLAVLNKIEAYLQEDTFLTEEYPNILVNPLETPLHSHSWNLAISHAGITARAKKWRDYHIAVSREEKEDIKFIVRTLAWKQVWEIWNQQDSLEKAGERIKHLHPLRFCLTLFSDEELKAGVAAIRERTKKIRDGFFDGIIGSLKEEAARRNLLPFISEFAEKVGIDEKWIFPSVEKEQWREFVNILIEKIPREKDPKRYNM